MPRRSTRRKSVKKSNEEDPDQAVVSDDQTEENKSEDADKSFESQEVDEEEQNSETKGETKDVDHQDSKLKEEKMETQENGPNRENEKSKEKEKQKAEAVIEESVNADEKPKKDDDNDREEVMDTIDAVGTDSSATDGEASQEENDVKDGIELHANDEDVDAAPEAVINGEKKEAENDKKADSEVIDDGLERMAAVPDDYAASFDDDLAEVSIDPELDEGENPAMPSEQYKKYWKSVKDEPQDFTAWTYLLQLVEQENVASLARRAYNEFFKRYPLCYGYWKKFSEFERRSNHHLRAQKILERGVRAIPLSVDLWVHVIDFYMKHYKGSDAGIDYTRKIMERAIRRCGEEFRSEKLWNKILRWEVENKAWKNVMAIYDRVLRTQTQHYSVFYSDLKDFVNAHDPRDLIAYQDFEEKLEKTRADAKAKGKEEKRDPVPADEMAPPGLDDGDSSMPPTEKELKSVRQKIIADKKKIYEATEALIAKIWKFEEGIKRPYFHVKALERTQIKNWRDYLDAEIARGEENHSRTILLFERCLIACALYEDFWIKYAKYVAKTNVEAARVIYKRACGIHLPKKATIHLHWATFEETNGFPEKSMEVLNLIDESVPGLAMVKIRKLAVLRRSNNVEKAEELLRSFIAGSTSDADIIFYNRKLVWFLAKVVKKVDEAREVCTMLFEKYKNQAAVYKDLLEFNYIYGDENSVLEVCDKACTNPNLSEEDKFYFSQRRLTYFDDFATDISRLQKAYDEHQKWTRIQRKRIQTESATSEPSAKKLKGESESKGSKISTTSNRKSSSNISAGATSYSAHPTKVAANTVYGQPTQYQVPAASAADTAQYYQNYWQQYGQKPADPAAQYNYNQWAQYYQQ